MAKGLLILKVNLFATNRDLAEIRKIIEPQIKTGLLILPPYLDPMVVPDDLEIKIEPGVINESISQLKDKYQKTEGSQSES